MTIMNTLPAHTLTCLIVLILCTVAPVEAAIQLQFDYSYDTYNVDGFFADGSAARSTLEAVGDFYASILGDDLLGIYSNRSNHFDGYISKPDTGDTLVLEDLDISADTVRIYVGSYDLGGNILGRAGPGGYSVSGSTTWVTNAITRGEGSKDDVQGPTATEFAPWGGSMSIDAPPTQTEPGTNWNLDHTAEPAYNESDLYSVMLHEIGHVLGLGTANSWENLISGTEFTGAAAVAEHGGPVAVTDGAHWDTGTTSTVFTGDDSQDAAMTPSITTGTRKVFTALDVAGLDDIGWDIAAYGDANLDGKIDDIDATIVATNWLRPGATWSQGDFNSDGTVDDEDAALMAANWQSTWGSAAASVPEPSSAALLMSALVAIVGFRRRLVNGLAC